jgi:surface polysaccharide O-acyltransferase-like enzyme
LQSLDHPRGRTYNVDLIRAIAIVGVVFLHASGRWTVTPQQFTQMNQWEVLSWSTVDAYQTLGCVAVPLFVMLHGALLLQPGKNESILVFFRKRWNRIGLPFLFWGATYFVWDFVVVGIPFSLNTIIQGILNGPYTHFWYCYMLIGLYLMTPILRVFLAQANRAVTTYFILIWFFGVIIPPIVLYLTPFTVNANIFTIGEFIGYFVLGTFLFTLQISRRIIVSLMTIGFALTAFLTYVLTIEVGGTQMYLFQEYFSPTVILASATTFLLLRARALPPIGQLSTSKGHSPSILNKLVKAISENILPIFLFHVMILESIRNGYFGFTINRNTINPIIDVPLETVVTFFISLGIILLLKRVPLLKKLIG